MPIIGNAISPFAGRKKSWSSYCTPLITEENEYFITEEGSYFCAEEDDDE